jgi:hypothetical protein
MGDVEALAGLMALYSDRTRLAAMGRNARRKIAAYSVEAAGDALLSAVETVRSRRKIR